jgi:methylated-DNA-[protein]-cysteine S-methyltransferase
MLGQPLRPMIWEFETELGWIGIVGADQLLRGVTFGHATRQDCLGALDKSGGERLNWNRKLVDRLIAFAEGAVDDFLEVQLDQTGRTAFQQSVTRHCRSIPVGETRSYAELARLAGKPGAARAVGSVMASNRFPLIVPCHRVVRADGVIGHFSAPGGAVFKQRLLQHEASMFAVR